MLLKQQASCTTQTRKMGIVNEIKKNGPLCSSKEENKIRLWFSDGRPAAPYSEDSHWACSEASTAQLLVVQAAQKCRQKQRCAAANLTIHLMPEQKELGNRLLSLAVSSSRKRTPGAVPHVTCLACPLSVIGVCSSPGAW